MAVKKMTVQTGATGVQTAGQDGGGDPICTLDVPLRPRFFSGQLLTDDDLMTLVSWNQDKQRLAHFRHGWGVVRGLDVRPDPDPKKPGYVVVDPGYAVDCSGRDIVVCGETSCNILAVCQDKNPPPLQPAPSTGTGPKVELFGCYVPASQVYALDLFIHYEEDQDAFQAAPGAAAGQTAPGYQPTRTRETFRLEARSPKPEEQPDPVEQWRNGFDACREVVTEYSGHFGSDWDAAGKRAPDRKDWLRHWIDRHPPRYFSGLASCLNDQTFQLDEQSAVQVLFWLVQDARNTFLAGEDDTCDPQQGLRLARVWLRGQDEKAGRTYTVLAAAPYRRPLRRHTWPAHTGQVNLAQALWRPYDEAYALLHGLGVRLGKAKRYDLPGKVEDLNTWLQQEMIIRIDREVRALYYHLDPDDQLRSEEQREQVLEGAMVVNFEFV